MERAGPAAAARHCWRALGLLVAGLALGYAAGGACSHGVQAALRHGTTGPLWRRLGPLRAGRGADGPLADPWAAPPPGSAWQTGPWQTDRNWHSSQADSAARQGPRQYDIVRYGQPPTSVATVRRGPTGLAPPPQPTTRRGPAPAGPQWPSWTAPAGSNNAILHALKGGSFSAAEVRAVLGQQDWPVAVVKRFVQDCVRQRKMEAMLTTMEWMHENNVTFGVQFYTRIMMALSQLKLADEALRVFDLMVNARVVPDVFAFCAIIAALRNVGRADNAITVYELMLKLGIRPNPVVYTLVTMAYADAGGWESAWNFFQQWRGATGGIPPELLNYNAMAMVLGNGGQPEKVRLVMAEMTEQGHKPDATTYAALMRGYEAAGQWPEAVRTFREMQASGLPPDKAAYDALILCYARAAMLDEAQEVLAEMLQRRLPPTADTFNALLLGCSRAGKYRDATRIYREMRARGVPPTIVTFEHLIALCRREGLGDEAQDYYAQMLERGIQPDERFDALLGAAVTPRRDARPTP